MPKLIINLLVIVVVFSMPVFADNEPLAVPAKSSDFIGIWKLVLKDNAVAKEMLKEDPWPAECQFFGHYSNGIWLHQQTHLGDCNCGIPDKAPIYPVNVTWKMERDGFLTITRPDHKIKEPWKVDKVTRDAHLGNTNLNKGDLLMQLYGPNKQGFIYVRILRRIKKL